MSIDYIGDPTTYHDIVELPTDGDDRDAACVTAPFEACLDNIEYVKQRKNVSTAVVKWLENAQWQGTQWTPLRASGSKGGWASEHSDGSATVEQNVFDVDIPHNSTITQVQAYIDPGTGHGALPASMPRWELQAHAPHGNISVLDSQTDTSGNVAAYEADHTIAKASLSHTVNRDTTRYKVVVFCEAGANSKTGFVLEGVKVTFNTTHIDQRAG